MTAPTKSRYGGTVNGSAMNTPVMSHRDSKDFSLPAPGVSGETPALTSGALSSPWALERKAGGNPRKPTSDDSGPTPLLNPVTPPAPDAATLAGTRHSSQAQRRCSPTEVRDSVEVAAPRRSAWIQRFAQTLRSPTSRIGLFSLFTKGTVLGGLHDSVSGAAGVGLLGTTPP
ncbi:hypothetical protein NDU88_003556 [Pleurodeles waltl]|uniref:Uncharacterized protein n=1 Tax=Pleurodeles waltl TaxID=8319 RepID=A0AAV7VEI3_PLEWA|nr:hypothetical protein NDU88_003556 [Pleurodeles waltl]